MKKILIPMDFSTEAIYALELAKQIAENYTPAEILLVNIVDPPTHSSFSATGEYVALTMDDLFILKLIEKVKMDMDDLVTDPRFQNLNIKERIKVGNQFQSLAEEITSIPADLIIIGTQPRKGFEELLRESTAEKVVRYATCPVITVKNKPEYFKLQDIVFASNFKEEIPAINKLKEIQELFSAKLHLLYINGKNDPTSSEKMRLRMKAFAETVGLKNYTINIHHSTSREKGINQFAEKINADVIAMATHARKGFLHLVMGSLTEDLVNHCNTMMLTFHMKEEMAM